jgi:N-acetylglucosamine-6-phosphate deacetylase
VQDGVIHEVGEGAPPRDALDLGERILTPGFIDLQINGVGTTDFASAAPDEWRPAGDVLAHHGITALCPTFVSAPLGEYDGMLTNAASARSDADGSPGSPTILGVHLEGPFLGGVPGAHPPELLRTADCEWLAQLLRSHPDVVRIVTLAPEADPDLAAIRMLRAAGVVVALGHSDASYDEAIAAADAGASLATHLFNGMGPMHHREPGLGGAALDDDRLTPTVIADLVHVHPAALRLAIARKPNIALVSDAVASPSLGDVADAVRLPDGRLAGATALLDRAVANVVGLGVALERAITMASSVPAAVLGLSDRGRIVAGARADLVALEPSTLAVDSVWIAGEPGAGRIEI